MKGGAPEEEVIDRFFNFIEELNKLGGKSIEIDSSFLPIIKRTINKHPNLSEICYVDESHDSAREINLNDQSYRNFRTVYTNLKRHYINSVKKLLKILENDILTITKAENGVERYNVNNHLLSSRKLYKVETHIRKLLSEYYFNCQKMFSDAVNALYEGVQENKGKEIKDTDVLAGLQTLGQ